ncbi:MAG: hypothetical protein KBH81_03495 [Phycisphaerae bacterium]|nr:hypothetical protein [Phycisphaerae bacterium]
MARGSVNIFEQHVEKITLGLAAVFLLLMVYLYMVRSPNRVSYGNQKLAPAELTEAIQRDTEALKKAMSNAPAVDTDVPDYSAQLLEQHSAGLFKRQAGQEPLVPDRLPWAADFGLPIPNLAEEQEEGQSDIALVPPLAPTAPVSRAGRNLVIRERSSLTQTSEDDEGGPASEAVELPWVTVAAYFDRAAQQDAMTKAGYATYLSKIYIAGVDVQRQELLADGNYSEWQDVTPSMAMPQVGTPAPEIDANSGVLINRDALNNVFATIKANQASICQPPFYRIEAGEEWRMPPLDGYPDADGPKTAAKGAKQPSKEDGRKGPIKVDPNPVDDKTARDKATQALKRAEDAYRSGQDDAALQAAEEVLGNKAATARARNRARAIRRSVRLMEKQKGASAKPAFPVQTRKEGSQEANLVAHPDDPNKVAVWFHDDTVESGKSYRYRLRVNLWNRYLGKFAALKDREQAKLPVLLGDWSLPGEPVTVPPAAYFFVTSAPPGKDTVGVTVYKWHKGERVSKIFYVGVGDLIGQVQEGETGILDRETLQPTRESVDYSTGALVLDLRLNQPVVQRNISDKEKGEFSLRDTESAVLVYLDPADGQVKQRVERFDRYDPTLRALRDLEEGTEK